MTASTSSTTSTALSAADEAKDSADETAAQPSHTQSQSFSLSSLTAEQSPASSPPPPTATAPSAAAAAATATATATATTAAATQASPATAADTSSHATSHPRSAAPASNAPRPWEVPCAGSPHHAVDVLVVEHKRLAAVEGVVVALAARRLRVRMTARVELAQQMRAYTRCVVLALGASNRAERLRAARSIRLDEQHSLVPASRRVLLYALTEQAAVEPGEQQQLEEAGFNGCIEGGAAERVAEAVVHAIEASTQWPDTFFTFYTSAHLPAADAPPDPPATLAPHQPPAPLDLLWRDAAGQPPVGCELPSLLPDGLAQPPSAEEGEGDMQNPLFLIEERVRPTRLPPSVPSTSPQLFFHTARHALPLPLEPTLPAFWSDARIDPLSAAWSDQPLPPPAAAAAASCCNCASQLARLSEQVTRLNTQLAAAQPPAPAAAPPAAAACYSETALLTLNAMVESLSDRVESLSAQLQQAERRREEAEQRCDAWRAERDAREREREVERADRRKDRAVLREEERSERSAQFQAVRTMLEEDRKEREADRRQRAAEQQQQQQQQAGDVQPGEGEAETDDMFAAASSRHTSPALSAAITPSFAASPHASAAAFDESPSLSDEELDVLGPMLASARALSPSSSAYLLCPPAAAPTASTASLSAGSVGGSGVGSRLEGLLDRLESEGYGVRSLNALVVNEHGGEEAEWDVVTRDLDLYYAQG